MTSPARRARIALTSLALAAAGLVTGGVTTAVPAQAAETAVTGASFTWGLNGYAQQGVFGPWSYSGLGGNAVVLRGSVSGGSQIVYGVAPVPATSMPASTPQKTPNAVRFSGGAGTADPATGAMTLAWTGSYTVNAYPASYDAPDETYSDPRLVVAADGSGSLTMELVLGAGQDIDGNPTPPQDLGRLTLLDFAAGSRTAPSTDLFRLRPAYQGVQVTVPSGTAQNRTCTPSGGSTGWWGSWPAAFVTAVPEAIRPHFYSTGCGGLQDTKPPLPVDVDLTPPALSTTAVSAPARRFGQSAVVTVAVASAGATGGPVTLTGYGAARTAPVVDGRATFDLGRPAVRSYALTATYAGNATSAASTASTVLSVTRAATTTTAKVTARPTTRKPGRLQVTLASATTAPAGRVTVVVKKGARTVKTITASLRNRGVTVALPRGAKGAWRAVVTYAGNANVTGSTRTASYRITK